MYLETNKKHLFNMVKTWTKALTALSNFQRTHKHKHKSSMLSLDYVVLYATLKGKLGLIWLSVMINDYQG